MKVSGSPERINLVSALATVDRTVGSLEKELAALSRTIHRAAECAFEEHLSAKAIAQTLENNGMQVQLGLLGMDTAVRSTLGDENGLRVIICAEYDALPEIGHGCGHNLIAASAVGAFLALAPLVKPLGIHVTLLGTPAEEHGGGKIGLLAKGAWDGADCTLMVHPVVADDDVSAAKIVMHAVERLEVEFTGRAAHSAATPENGINAGDAATLALVAVGLLRQQLPSEQRVSAFIVNGGTLTNLIPHQSRVKVEMRAASLAELAVLRTRIVACFDGAALATGCGLHVARSEPGYADLRTHPALAQAWDADLDRIGRPPVPRVHFGGSTDMGNVSHRIPAIHPYLAIRDAQAQPHTVEFADVADSPAAHVMLTDGARALAGTVTRIALDPQLRRELIAARLARTPETTRSDPFEKTLP